MTVANLKLIIRKLFKVPPPKQVLIYRKENGGDTTALDEPRKTLSFFGVEDGGEIIVEMKQK